MTSSIALKRRVLRKDEFEAIKALRRDIITAVNDITVIAKAPNEDDYILSHLGPSGESIGVFDREKLIAYSAIGFPKSGEPCMATYIPGNKVSTHDAAHMSATMVLPGYRGMGLQRELTVERLRLGQAAGRTSFFAMISPQNYYSWQNLVFVGFHICALAANHNNHLRFVLRYRDEKKYVRSKDLDDFHLESAIIPYSDTEKIRNMFTLGYVGTSTRTGPNGLPEIQFR